MSWPGSPQTDSDFGDVSDPSPLNSLPKPASPFLRLRHIHPRSRSDTVVGDETSPIWGGGSLPGAAFPRCPNSVTRSPAFMAQPAKLGAARCVEASSRRHGVNPTLRSSDRTLVWAVSLFPPPLSDTQPHYPPRARARCGGSGRAWLAACARTVRLLMQCQPE